METLHAKHAGSRHVPIALYRAIRGAIRRIARVTPTRRHARRLRLDRGRHSTTGGNDLSDLRGLAHYSPHGRVSPPPGHRDPGPPRAPPTTPAKAGAHFAAETFELGAPRPRSPAPDATIGIYSPARCIADAFRLRGDLGYEIGRDALREWLRARRKARRAHGDRFEAAAGQGSDPARTGTAVVRDGDEVFRQIQRQARSIAEPKGGPRPPPNF